MVAGMQNNTLETLVRQVKAEPKKAIALALLVAVLVAMWVKIFVFGDPRTATAGVSSGENLKDGRSHILNFQVSPGRGSLLEWTKKPITGTKRNLFAIKLD